MCSMYGQDLYQIPLFYDFTSEQIELIQSLVTLVQFTMNQVIFAQGQTAAHLFILIKGEVEVRYKPYDGPPMSVARITPGGVFGWSAALQRDEYTSEALALANSSAYRMSVEAIQALPSLDPETSAIFFDRLAGVIAERLNTTHQQIVNILRHQTDIDQLLESKKI